MLTRRKLLAAISAMLAGCRRDVPIVFQGGCIGRGTPPPDPGGGLDGILWSEWVDEPAAGEDWEIPADTTIILDVVTPNIGAGIISGLLYVPPDAGTVGIYCTKLHGEEGGEFRIGNSEADPFTGHIVIECNGPESVIPDPHDRGFMCHDDFIRNWYGNPPTVVATRLNAHAAIGATVLTLEDDVSDWPVGAEIVIGITDYPAFDTAERRTIQSVSGNQVTLTAGLTRSKWGLMQYATDAGASLTADAWTLRPHADCRQEIDERADVFLITHNIVFQGPNDSAWSTDRFGAHIMNMTNTVTARCHGVEYLRCGQRGILGRYPEHFHLCSYTVATGEFLGAFPTDQAYFSKCSTVESAQRAVTIHSTWGVRIEDHNLYDIQGHGIFFEDATERDNIVRRVVGSKLRGFASADLSSRAPINANHEAAKSADSEDERGTFLIWLTNPDNIVTDCSVSDSEGGGLWCAFPTGALGLSGAVPLGTGGAVVAYPSNIHFSEIRDIRAIGCAGCGHLLRGAPIDAAGNVDNLTRYGPSDLEGAPGSVPLLQSPHVIGLSAFKCYSGIWRNNSSIPLYDEFVACDNEKVFFNGTTTNAFVDTYGITGLGTIRHATLGAYSLNNANPARPAPLPYDYSAASYAPSGLATYHSTIKFVENFFFGFTNVVSSGTPPTEYFGSGALLLNDFYTDAVERTFARHTGNTFATGTNYRFFRTPPPNLCGTDIVNNRRFTFAGAIWDRENILGGGAGYYNVYDIPFLTAEAGYHVTRAQDGPCDSAFVDGEYHGCQNFRHSKDNGGTGGYVFEGGVKFTRYDSGGSVVGDPWEVPVGTGGILSVMRHAALRSMSTGHFGLEWPELSSQPTWVVFALSNMHGSSREVVIGVKMDLTSSISEAWYACSQVDQTGSARQTLSSAGSLAAVKAGDGQYYWADTANNRLYVKFVGDNLTWPGTPQTDSDMDLMRHYVFAARTSAGAFYVED